MPKTTSLSRERGQGVPEYAILLALIAIVVIAVLVVLGPQISQSYSRIVGTVPGQTKTLTSVEQLAADFLSRINAYYQQNGKWPSTDGKRQFTDLGLNPADWAGAVNGLIWNPEGDKISLKLPSESKGQILVKDTNGKTVPVKDDSSIWCTSGGCYVNTNSSVRQVDLSTLTIVGKSGQDD